MSEMMNRCRDVNSYKYRTEFAVVSFLFFE